MRHSLRKLALQAVSGSPLEPLLRRILERLALTRGARYDRETAAVMHRALTRRSTCVDIGCYRGSILAQMLAIAPEGRHFAFEPVPDNYSYLAKHFPQARIFNMALADYAGEADFQHVIGRPARSGLRRVPYPDPNQEVKQIKVKVGTLDSTLPDDVKLDFVKIDVEGAELLVLRGGRKTLTRCKPVIVFEFGPAIAGCYGTQAEDVYDLLTAEIGLQVSLMSRWLAGQEPLRREEFLHCVYDHVEFYFIAYP